MTWNRDRCWENSGGAQVVYGPWPMLPPADTTPQLMLVAPLPPPMPLLTADPYEVTMTTRMFERWQVGPNRFVWRETGGTDEVVWWR